jgi:DNA-binding response OmpR family regulator
MFTHQLPVEMTHAHCSQPLEQHQENKVPRLEATMLTYVLLVDDDEITRMTIGRMLEQQGYYVTTAPDGDMALELLAQHTFDIVITDIQLGYIDGFHILKVAKSLERPPSVVMITGNTSLDNAIKALRNGASDYFIKPCSREDLLMRLRIVAKQHESEILRVDIIRTVLQMADQVRAETFIRI